jgi:hypothetical protein
MARHPSGTDLATPSRRFRTLRTGPRQGWRRLRKVPNGAHAPSGAILKAAAARKTVVCPRFSPSPVFPGFPRTLSAFFTLGLGGSRARKVMVLLNKKIIFVARLVLYDCQRTVECKAVS